MCKIINIKFLQRILILLAFFSLFVCIITFEETYGKYVSNIDESANIKIARWRILLNGEDIRNNSIAKTTIAPVFEGNDNIQNNVIAPHAEGYFDLIIDGSDADVSFKYDISISVNEESSVKDLIVTGYKINDDDKVETNIANISNIVPITDENKIINVRVFIKWNDDDEATMNNEEDTIATTTDITAKLDVLLKFTQMAT